MPSSPISQPAARRSKARHPRGWRTGQSHAAVARQVQAGPGELAERRARLEECWRVRLERVTALSLAYHDEVQGAEQESPVDGGGSRRALLLARQAVAERQALAEIEAALDRIASGQYGWCEQCDRPIAAALLAAQPQARYCAVCAGSRRVSRSGKPCRPSPVRSALPGWLPRVNRLSAAR